MFKNAASEFIFYRTYARWIEELKRRETWPETVDRYVAFITKDKDIPPKVIKKIRQYILSFDVMPSMRAMWAAGEAAERDNTCIYNCSFRRMDSVEAFAENLYILMCGTGFGFSVTQEDVACLPTVPLKIENASEIYVIEDNKEGWANSIKHLIASLYTGKDVDFDYSKLRPKGAKLSVMGGRSSGPEPVIVLHNFIKEVIHSKKGQKLSTLNVHDISNQIAEIVVAGGVRRSSEISLSDLDDQEMRNAKVGNYPLRRAMANNSAIYTKKPSAVEFLQEWSSLAASGTGERGIFNLEGAIKKAPKRRKAELIAGTNPCGEIMLRHKEFCNLSEVVIRSEDDMDTLLDKVETAVWIGCIQSTFTHFPYLSPEWQKNCEEERLLGVSLTGQLDNPEMLTEPTLKALKNKAIKIAKHASSKLGINMPVAITCVKPSGTVSQLVDSASGLHPRFSEYYIRRYRISATDPLFKMMKAQGIKLTPENGQTKDNASTWVVSFPIKAPEGCITVEDMTAIEQLEHYKKIQSSWCEHNASATIYCKDEEWFEVGNWVYQNWEFINGVSFLPADGGKYKQAPYEKISKEEYERLSAEFPLIDYEQLSMFELEDNTTGASNLACVAGVCELN